VVGQLTRRRLAGVKSKVTAAVFVGPLANGLADSSNTKRTLFRLWLLLGASTPDGFVADGRAFPGNVNAEPLLFDTGCKKPASCVVPLIPVVVVTTLALEGLLAGTATKALLFESCLSTGCAIAGEGRALGRLRNDRRV
jgi:hypothetical protein